MSNCIWKVETRAGSFVGTERELNRHFYGNGWERANVEHSEFCMNPECVEARAKIVIPADPFGDPSQIVSPF